MKLATTPMIAPPAMRPLAMSTPRLSRALASASEVPGLGRFTQWERRPPRKRGMFSSMGRYMPRAKPRAGSSTIRSTRESTTPRPKQYQRRGMASLPKMPSRIAFMALAWGAGMLVPRAMEPSTFTCLAISHMAMPVKIAATRVPTNFQAIWRAGVAPIQWPIFRSVAKAPLAARAVHTMPPTIMVRNIP